GRVAALSERCLARLELRSVLSARQLCSPVHRLGFELLQVLLSSACWHALRRTRAAGRFWPLDKVVVERRAQLLSLSGFPITQHHVTRRPAIFPGLSRRPQRCDAIRCCFSFVRRQSGFASGAALSI